MGSFIGHALPGSFFLLVGFWWLFHVLREYAASLKPSRSPQPQRSWKSIRVCRSRKVLVVEPFVKLILAVAGICIEIGRIQWRLVDEHNQFRYPNKFAHGCMYGFFGLSGLIELLNFYKFTYFSREFEYTVLAVAFSVEGMLFYFHLQGRDIFDVRVHTILFIIIFLTTFVILLEACLVRHQRELFMARTLLCLTQGTWFYEICFTIYGPHRWITDSAKMSKFNAEELMLDTEVATVNICWHVLGWSGVMLVSCLVTSCLETKGQLCCADNSGDECDKGTGNGRLDPIKELDEEIGLLGEEGRDNNTEEGREDHDF